MALIRDASGNALSREQMDAIKRDRVRIEALLIEDGARNVAVEGAKFLCPYHRDRNPSAEIRECPSGYYFICYACDLHLDYFALVAFRENIPFRDAVQRTGTTEAEVSRQLQEPDLVSAEEYLRSATSETGPKTIDSLLTWYLSKNPRAEIQEVNKYTDPETGVCDFATVRIYVPGRGKKMLPLSSDADGNWTMKQRVSDDPLPLFNRGRVRDAQNILVVEGEKCVRAFTALEIEGWAATTSPGGSNKADKADWSPLSGKDVVFWRDYDNPGRSYQSDVIALLRALEVPPRSISLVKVDELGLDEGGDIADYLLSVGDEQREHVGAVLHVLGDLKRWSPSLATEELYDKIERGEYTLISMPMFPQISRLTQALLPGKLTAFCGSPGSAKSWLAEELGWKLTEAGVHTETLFLEDGTVDYQRRAIAQMAGRPEVLDFEWVAQNLCVMRQIYLDVKDRLDAYFDHVTCMQSKIITAEDVLDWITRMANKRARVIIVDPVTAVQATRSPWISDQKLILESQRIVEDSGSSLVYFTHPKQGKAGAAGLDGMAGGQAWSRFTHTDIWLEVEREGPKLSTVKVPGEFLGHSVEHMRKAWITKARNGAGEWKRFAIDLDLDTMRFVEHGEMMREQEIQRAVEEHASF